MSSIIGRANLLLTTSIGGGVHVGINERMLEHPHSALGYRSPREYLRRRISNGLSDKKCMEI